MNILGIVRRACLEIDVEPPSAFFSSTERTMLELQSTVNAASQQILEEYEWSRLIKTATVTGDGTATAFPLPTDYNRMVRDANLWGPNWTFYPSQQMQDFNAWLQIQSFEIETWQQRWMIFGGNLNVMPVLPATDTLTYGYISSNIVVGADPTEFTADTDTFVLDDETLRLGIIWNWKAQKGFDYSTELGKYQARLDSQRYNDVGARQTIVSGGRRGYGWAGWGGAVL